MSGWRTWCQPAAAAGEGGLVTAFRRLWSQREEVAAAMTRAREPLAAQEERRWQQLLARLGWTRESAQSAEPPVATLLGWPADRTDRLAAAALAALALERQASEAETSHWRGVVNHLERSAGLAVRAIPGRERRTMEEKRVLTEQQWNDYSRDGFLHLGKVLEPEELEALRQRADDLALGNVKNPDVQMQLDTGGAYEELPGAVPAFDRGTPLYRKIQGLETDELFARLVRHPLFLEVCARQYGPHAADLDLPRHGDEQAGRAGHAPAMAPGRRRRLGARPRPAGHHLGRPRPGDAGERLHGGGPRDPPPGPAEPLRQHASRRSTCGVHCPAERVQPLEVEPGHAVLLHNWLIHRSGVNPSPAPRRALTVCYMDGRTQSILTGKPFPLVAGSLPAEPYPFVDQLRQENALLREAAIRAEEYARSLEEERERLRPVPRPQGWLSRVRARLAAATR